MLYRETPLVTAADWIEERLEKTRFPNKDITRIVNFEKGVNNTFLRILKT